MAIFGAFRADQLISQLIAEQDPNSPTATKLVNRIKKAGPKAIPKVIDALAMSDKTHTMIFVDILSDLVNDKTIVSLKLRPTSRPRCTNWTRWSPGSSIEFVSFFTSDSVDTVTLQSLVLGKIRSIVPIWRQSCTL